MANEKGAGGIVSGTSHVSIFERGTPGPPLAARSSSVYEQLTPDGGGLSLVVVKLPHAADEYDECSKRAPESESSMVTTASCVAGTFQLERSYEQ